MVSTAISIETIWAVLETVTDPEVPVLSILDLGIVRDVKIREDEVDIVITPTYSGCPAMDTISMMIRMELLSRGVSKVNISQRLSPAWTTDWMSEAGRTKLKVYGIAPPNMMQSVCEPKLFAAADAVQCPQCNSYHTKRLSEFGSTACKSLYQCEDCKEPFDYFKCH
jgi:ring-1,2-phenylacetyl-CoA epoxidase subunit PaaD